MPFQEFPLKQKEFSFLQTAFLLLLRDDLLLYIDIRLNLREFLLRHIEQEHFSRCEGALRLDRLLFWAAQAAFRSQASCGNVKLASLKMCDSLSPWLIISEGCCRVITSYPRAAWSAAKRVVNDMANCLSSYCDCNQDLLKMSANHENNKTSDRDNSGQIFWLTKQLVFLGSTPDAFMIVTSIFSPTWGKISKLDVCIRPQTNNPIRHFVNGLIKVSNIFTHTEIFTLLLILNKSIVCLNR